MHVHEIEHDKRCKYIEMTCLANGNLNERSYSLKRQIKRKKKLIYEHYMEEKTKSIDTQTYLKSHN